MSNADLATIAIGLQRNEITQADADQLMLEYHERQLNAALLRLDQLKADGAHLTELQGMQREVQRLTASVQHYQKLVRSEAA